jgi:hypothetical protein
VGSGVGWTYGGRTIQGLLPYYFLVELPALEGVPEAARAAAVAGLAAGAARRSKAGVHGRQLSTKGTDLELNRCRYNNMVQLEKCKKWEYEAVVSNHFTGDCVKPWWCQSASHPLCRRFADEWLKTAVNFAQEKLGPMSSYNPCKDGSYRPLPT